jgi:hypothetical protein
LNSDSLYAFNYWVLCKTFIWMEIFPASTRLGIQKDSNFILRIPDYFRIRFIKFTNFKTKVEIVKLYKKYKMYFFLHRQVKCLQNGVSEWLLFNANSAIFQLYNIMARTSQFLMRWWWGSLCTRSLNLLASGTGTLIKSGRVKLVIIWA